MSGGVLGNCPTCSRLLIVGQRCMCAERPTSRCDCSHDGNRETTGPNCRQREQDAWAAAMKTSRNLRAALDQPAPTTPGGDA